MPGQNRRGKGRGQRRTYSTNTRDSGQEPAFSGVPSGLPASIASRLGSPQLNRCVSQQVTQ